MADFKNKAKGFSNPTQLPQSQEQQDEWNRANRDWWEKAPMRYDFSKSLEQPEFSKAFFSEIDRRFFAASAEFSPYKFRPFEEIIDFEYIKDKSVLEIGVGNGSHAELLSANCGDYTGIDLTEYAVESTKERLRLAGLTRAKVLRMNAEAMLFENNQFDYIWSWGVIHHSANTLQILHEMNRVLKPKARATVMVYYRSHWYKYIYAGLLHGVLKGYFMNERSLDKVVQRTIDGAIARFYRMDEWREVCNQASFKVTKMKVMGDKSSIVLFPPGRVKEFLKRMIPGKISRLMTNRLRMGYFLVAEMEKM